MSLSRPIYNLVGAYFEQLFNHPIRTKSLTSSILASTASLTSQKITGQQKINYQNVFSYGLFGLLFGGPLPHIFYDTIEKIIPEDMRLRKHLIFICERLILAPSYLLLSLYFLSRFEGNEHKIAFENLKKLYWPLLEANWKFLSIPFFLNIYFVPPVLRVFVANIIGFLWVLYTASKRRKQQHEQQQQQQQEQSGENKLD